MLKYLKNILSPPEALIGSIKIPDENNYQRDRKRVQLATCILFVEIAKADSIFAQDERDKIISVMNEKFNLDNESIKELIELSEENAKVDSSIYEYTNLINQNFSNDEKYELLRNLWRLVFVDENMDKYEEQMVKKIGIFINVDYRDIISSKMEIKKELKK